MDATEAFRHTTADISPEAVIALGAKIWNYAQVRERAVIGSNVIIGRGAYIGSGVEVGPNSKIQNYALIYEPARLEAGVFVGPAVVFTNDLHPRAVNPDLGQKDAADWQAVGVHVKEGASIGANATCVAPVTLGRWSMVGAGSVVIKDVPDFALVVGSPARRIGWVGKAGHQLKPVRDGVWVCPVSGDHYIERQLNELTEEQ